MFTQREEQTGCLLLINNILFAMDVGRLKISLDTQKASMENVFMLNFNFKKRTDVAMLLVFFVIFHAFVVTRFRNNTVKFVFSEVIRRKMKTFGTNSVPITTTTSKKWKNKISQFLVKNRKPIFDKIFSANGYKEF